MNRNRFVFIGMLALALGAFASAIAYRSLQAHAAEGQASAQEVVVATNDLAVGSRVQEKDIRVVKIPADTIPPGSFRDTKRVVGRGVVIPIVRGEFLLPGKLAAENAGSGLPALIPPGMRAVSVRVNDTSSVAGFVVPGTRVDVLMTGNPIGSNEPQTVTVLRNVAVLASGQRLDRSILAGETQNAPVITLLVSPDDAARLALATNQGRIQLALRNPLDTTQTDVAAINARALYQKSGAIPGSAPVHPRVKPVSSTAVSSAPSSYPVEVIRGDKRDVTKLPE
jgi:pilus assembly protein CpaB